MLQHPLQHPAYNQQFLPNIPHQYYGPAMSSSLHMMAPPFSNSPAWTTTNATTNEESGAQRKNNRWSDTEERIFIELFGENEDELRYKAFNSPEWQSIARQLQEKCKRENVESNKSAQQCKNKMANLTKKYKTVKDKLRTTGYGKWGDNELDKETESETDLIPKHFNDMDAILGNREAVNPKHVLESSSYVESSPEIDRDLLEKEALDEEIWAAARTQKARDAPGTSGEGNNNYCADCSDDEEEELTFSKSRAGEKSAKKNVRNKAQCFRSLKELSRGMRLLWSG